MKIMTAAEYFKEEKQKPIIDYEEGIRRIGGNPELYQEILLCYYEETLGLSDKISAAINLDEFTAACDMVHKLKGSSGNIGAKRLYYAAIELQNVLKTCDRPAIRRELSIFTEQLKLVRNEIETHNSISSTDT